MKADEKAHLRAAEVASFRSTGWLESAISGISAQLKGPGISQGERLCLHAERKAYRDALAEKDQTK